MLRLILLHLVFGGAWVGGALLLPDRPGEMIAFLYAFGGGAIALLGPVVFAYWRDWL